MRDVTVSPLMDLFENLENLEKLFQNSKRK